MKIPGKKSIQSNLLFLFLAVLFLLSACTEQDDSRQALGTLERDRVTLSATAAEVITALPVPEGSAVAEGDLLVQLDSALQQAVLNKARADVMQAQAFLDKLHNGPRPEEISAAQARTAAARAALLEIEREYNRIERMVRQQLMAAADLETAETRRDSRRANLNEAEEQLLLLTSGTREEEVRQAQAQLNATQAVLAREEQNLANLSIFATRAGILDNLPWNIGERVYLGAPLAILLVSGSPYARAYIPEPYRARVNSGDSLQVKVDGVEELYRGTVKWISTEPAFTPYYALNQEERSRLVFLAEIQLDDSARDLPSGLPVQVLLP